MYRSIKSAAHRQRRPGDLRQISARTAVITAQVGSVPLWERPQLAGSYWNARTSCAHRHATAILAAHCSAASREGSSSTV